LTDTDLDHALGVDWFITEKFALEDAQTHPGRVVVACGPGEPMKWATVWKAQPLARLLTRKGQVVWQGVGLQGHWD
jgi:hypothetical protein